MNRQMWENPATQRNIQQLRDDGIVIEGPDSGDQACGENGMGRMTEPAQMVESIISWFQPKLLAGARILVTLIHALRNRSVSKGVASLCIGGGEAVAIAIETV